MKPFAVGPAATPPPTVAPQTVRKGAPFWSVMIPTYNPREDFLKQALESILVQDPGPEQMHIEVVDDQSSNGSVAELVHRIGNSRIGFSQTSRNLGLAGCWNECIAKSKGAWIHILHQDDLVADGFYAELAAVIAENSEAGSAFTRHTIANEDGHWLTVSDLEQSHRGLLRNWLPRIARWQRVQCAAMVVRRKSYEAVGGFREKMPYALDWEMWVRLAKHFPVAYTPRVLSVYRTHKESETSRLDYSARAEDVTRCFEIIRTLLDVQQASIVEEEFRGAFANALKFNARKLLYSGRHRQLRRLITENWSYFPITYKVLFTYYISRTLLGPLFRTNSSVLTG